MTEGVIERLYRGLGDRDGDLMADCYAAAASFEDPVFGLLTGDQVGAMWRMLTAGSGELEVDLTNVLYDGEAGSATWEARYVFPATGRQVVNRGRARFRFEHGLIVEHVDDFPFYRWARQALGMPGLLLGWTPFFRATVRKQARTGLERFMSKESD